MNCALVTVPFSYSAMQPPITSGAQVGLLDLHLRSLAVPRLTAYVAACVFVVYSPRARRAYLQGSEVGGPWSVRGAAETGGRGRLSRCCPAATVPQCRGRKETLSRPHICRKRWCLFVVLFLSRPRLLLKNRSSAKKLQSRG